MVQMAMNNLTAMDKLANLRRDSLSDFTKLPLTAIIITFYFFFVEIPFWGSKFRSSGSQVVNTINKASKGKRHNMDNGWGQKRIIRFNCKDLYPCCTDAGCSGHGGIPVTSDDGGGAFSSRFHPKSSARTCLIASGTGPAQPPIRVIRTRRRAGRLRISCATCTGGRESVLGGRARRTIPGRTRRTRCGSYRMGLRSPARPAAIWSGSAASPCPRPPCLRRTARRRVPRTPPTRI